MSTTIAGAGRELVLDFHEWFSVQLLTGLFSGPGRRGWQLFLHSDHIGPEDAHRMAGWLELALPHVHEPTDGLLTIPWEGISQAKLREVIRAWGFTKVRRATAGPFNMVLEARP